MLNVKNFYVNRGYLRSNSDVPPIWSRKKKFVPLPTLKCACTLPGARRTTPTAGEAVLNNLIPISIMAKARQARSLWVGKTKTQVYSTLATAKDGRVQVIKDRADKVSNPQTLAQMVQRVIFATVTKAAEKMFALISISNERQSQPQFAKQAFVSQNVSLLRKLAGRTETTDTGTHPIAAFAPKGNQQLIPNSYYVSFGSLQVPDVLKPKTSDTNGGSFAEESWSPMGYLGTGVPFGSYTPAQLWKMLFGLLPGDQLSLPQIYREDIAQVLYNSDDEDAEPVDLTIVADFVCPRIVLLDEMPSTTVAIGVGTTAAQVIDALKSGVNSEKTWETMADRLLDNIRIDEVADDVMSFINNDTFQDCFGINNDDQMVALGVILSRFDGSKWRYSTSQLVCTYNPMVGDTAYFGFKLQNAIDTYKATSKMTAEGNFIQQGGESDIIPEDFM